MLDLHDPLWKKLDDASYRELDIPNALSMLAETWNDEQAQSLLWNHLSHQETCYGATYAAIPYLLKFAEPEESRHQRTEIAVFLGIIARSAFSDPHAIDEREKAALDGLPQTLDEWNARRDRYRNRIAMLEDPSHSMSSFEQTIVLPYYKDSLKIDPVNEDDLEKIRSIRRDFFESLPQIRALCERAFLENLDGEELELYLIAGMAAADGLYDLANLLTHGVEGSFRCSFCDWGYEYILFNDRVAIYAEEERNRCVGRALDDHGDGVPSRSDGFMLPIAANEKIDDRRTAALLELADRASGPVPMLMLRNFLGRFHCCKCGKDGPVAKV